MNQETKKCPFSTGCPFKDCQTREEIVNRFNILKSDPVWKPLLEKMESCPIWTKCPMSKGNLNI